MRSEQPRTVVAPRFGALRWLREHTSPAWLTFAFAIGALVSLLAAIVAAPSWQEIVVDSAGRIEALWLLHWLALIGLVAALLWQARALAAARKAESTFVDAIDSMGAAIALWDAEDSLICCNEAYRQMYPELRAELVPGANFLRLLKLYYRRGPAEIIRGRSEAEFCAIAETRRHGPPLAEVVRNRWDRYVLMSDYRSEDGRVLSLRLDVTEQGLIERALRNRRRMVDDLVELSIDFYWKQDADGRFTEITPGFDASPRLRAEALLGRTLADLPGFSVDAEHWREHQRLLKIRRPFPWLRVRAHDADGNPLWLLVRGKPMFDAAGHFEGFHGCLRDVTDNEEALAAHRTSEERLRALALERAAWYWETDVTLALTLIRSGSDADRDLERRLLGHDLRRLGAAGVAPESAIAEALAHGEPFRGYRVQIRCEREVAAEFEVAGQPQWRDGCFCGYRGFAWEVSSDGRSPGRPNCDCARAMQTCAKAGQR
jgi:PAS domain S-box-containing protein